MTQSFADKIAAKKKGALRDEHLQLELADKLFEFQNAWQPLIDHMKEIADQHLPGDVKLEIDFFTRANTNTFLEFALKRVGFIGNDIAILKYCHFKDLNETLNLGPYDLFHSNETSQKKHILKIKDMEGAKSRLEDWLATMIAANFDVSKTREHAGIKITIERDGIDDPAP